MDESPRLSVWQRSAALVIAVVMAAAALAVVGAANAPAASAASAGSVAVGSSKLGACKRKAVAACRKVTARKCRVSTTKRLRAQDKRVNKRKVARSCAKKAKRHCAKRAQKRKQARQAARCARPRSRTPYIRGRAANSGTLPTASSTGVPAGTRLKVVRGDLTVTTPGAVLRGLDIRGWVIIRANNVTIENTIIRGRSGGGTLLSNLNGNSGLVVRNSSLIATDQNRNLAGFKGRNASIDRVEIARVVDNVQVIGGALSITNSWLHSNIRVADDRYSDGVSHDDSIQVEGGVSTRIENNRIEGSHNAAIMVTQNWARVDGLTITDNFIQHGACTINADEKGKGAMAGFSISSNRFGPSMKYGKTCPLWVPRNSSVAMSGNAWADNGSAVTARFR